MARMSLSIGGTSHGCQLIPFEAILRQKWNGIYHFTFMDFSDYFDTLDNTASDSLSPLLVEEEGQPTGPAEEAPIRAPTPAEAEADYALFGTRIEGAHIHVLFGDRLKTGLQLTHSQLELLYDVGATEAPDGGVLICTAIFGPFLALKQNSVNANMRQHAFVRDRRYDAAKALRDLGVRDRRCYGKQWSHWCNVVVPGFNRSATRDDIEKLALYGSRIRNGGEALPSQESSYEELFITS
jgi:hypothetical protein